MPMYFFLNCLALSDLFYTSTVTPKLMTDLLMEKKAISYKNCIIAVGKLSLIVASRGYSLDVVHGLLITMASLVVEHKL